MKPESNDELAPDSDIIQIFVRLSSLEFLLEILYANCAYQGDLDMEQFRDELKAVEERGKAFPSTSADSPIVAILGQAMNKHLFRFLDKVENRVLFLEEKNR